MTELEALRSQVEALTNAVLDLARLHGARLTRHQMCERLGVCSKTLTTRVRQGDAPTPGADGKWLLAEVLEWEAAKVAP